LPGPSVDLDILRCGGGDRQSNCDASGGNGPRSEPYCSSGTLLLRRRHIGRATTSKGALGCASDSLSRGAAKASARQSAMLGGEMAADSFNLNRFVDAQSGDIFEQALAELKAGRKQSHWMWFIFPQHRDLGRSETAKYYGLSGSDEARAYAAHPLLGARLRECSEAILPHLRNEPPEAILGPVDALKLRSSMEIFAEAVPDEPLFRDVLEAGG